MVGEMGKPETNHGEIASKGPAWHVLSCHMRAASPHDFIEGVDAEAPAGTSDLRRFENSSEGNWGIELPR
jgi:hypothetical protein